MIDPDALEAATAEQPAASPAYQRWLPAALLLAFTALLAFWAMIGRSPDDNSLEAGFARDMMVHHDQAVAMALLARDRTSDPLIKTLATDIVLTQQNQIGQMFGWLNLWGLPATGKEPPMAWMGHPTEGQMPGMASPEDLANLESLSREEADIAFLELMIRHHKGGVPMAEAALERSDNPAVRALARQIVTAQEVEIATMETMLAEKAANRQES